MTNLLTVVAKVFSNSFAAKMYYFCNTKPIHILTAKMSTYMPYFKIEILTSC